MSFILFRIILMAKDILLPVISQIVLFRVHSQTTRVPTTPGKPGETGPDLENLEKQGVLGQKPGKILKNLEKNFDLTLKRSKSLNRKSIWKKKIQLKQEVNCSV